MPVAVVALAAGSFAAGATAFAAATTLAASVAAGATMVGSALTAVGTITGNQNLTKIGAVVGIAGGLGSLAASASDAASTAGAAADTASAGTNAAATGADAASAAGSSAGDAVSSALQTSPVNLSSDITPSASSAASDTGMLGSGPLITPVGTDASAASTAASTASAASPSISSAAAQGVSGSSNDFLTQALSNPTSTFDPNSIASGAGNAYDASSTQVGQALNMNPYSPPSGMLDSIDSYPGAIDAAANAPVGISTPISVNPAANTSIDNQFGGASGSGIGATLDQVQQWAKSNPVLAQAALNGTSGLLKNLVPSAKDKMMMQQYAAQTALQQQQTNLLKTRQLWGSGRTS